MSILIKEIEKLKPIMFPTAINLDLSDDCSIKFASELDNSEILPMVHNIENTTQNTEHCQKQNNENIIDHTKSFDPNTTNSKLYTIEEIPYIDSEPTNAKIEKNVSQWTNNELIQWAEKQNFSEDIFKFLKNFDGEILKQLYLIKTESPGYFYQVVSNNSKVSFENVAKFVIKLDLLFGQNKKI